MYGETSTCQVTSFLAGAGHGVIAAFASNPVVSRALILLWELTEFRSTWKPVYTVRCILKIEAFAFVKEKMIRINLPAHPAVRAILAQPLQAVGYFHKPVCAALG
jgi:hypothetical protein